MRKYILIAGLLASTQVQAIDFNLNEFANELLRLNTIPKIEKNVPTKNQDDEQIQAKTVENVPAQNQDEVNDEEIANKNQDSEANNDQGIEISNNDEPIDTYSINITEEEYAKWRKFKFYKDHEIRKWKSVGVNNPEEAVAWEEESPVEQKNSNLVKLRNEYKVKNADDVHVLAKKLKPWRNEESGFTFSNALMNMKQWNKIGIDTPEKAEEWQKNDISADKAQHFIKFGIKTPKDAAIWIRASNPDKSIIEEIEKWHAINVTTTEQLSKWMTALGYSSNLYYYRNDIEKINNLYKNQKNTLDLFLADKQELTKSGCQMDYSSYLQAHIPVSEAKVWCNLNIQASDVGELKKISVKPEELANIKAIKRAENWMSTENIVNDILKWNKSGYEVSEFNQWYELGKSVIGSMDNVIKWKQQNIPADVIKGWFSVGVNDFNSLPTFAKMGIKSPQEAQQWKAVGVPITYPSFFQQWLDMGFDTPAKIKVWTTVLPDLLSEDVNKHARARDTLKSILNAGYKTPEQYKVAQQKDQKENDKLKQERAKVKKACDAWYNKATEKTYSLKSGARVWSRTSGNVYTIDTVYQDSFLVWGGGTTWEMKKHLFVPYNELSNAPSEYCYK
jgi:hypothetical protein